MADFAALSADYFSVPDEAVKHIESVLTVVGGKVVYGAEEFSTLSPPLPPISNDWSPVRYYGGYHREERVAPAIGRISAHLCAPHETGGFALWPGWTGCDCFAF
jgi:hypothetical protein